MTDEERIELEGLRELRDGLDKVNQDLTMKWRTARDVAECLQETNNLLMNKIGTLSAKIAKMQMTHKSEIEDVERRLGIAKHKVHRLTVRLAEARAK